VSRPPLNLLVRRLRQTLDADTLTSAPDAELLSQFRRHRDPAAFEALVHRHGPRVHAACRRVLADPADADDAFQATFLVLMRNPAAVRDGRALGRWLAGVAHRVSLKAMARRRRREQVEARAEPRPAAIADLSWREACAILHEELDRLPDRHRLPLLLCYLEGLSRDEAAARLGRSVNTVKKALEAGRVRLRRRLVRRGVTLSAGLLAVAAESAGGEPSTNLMSPVIDGPVRPAVAALVRSLHAGSRVRAIGVGLAATVVAMGIALGFPGGPKPTHVSAKDGPAKDTPKGVRIAVSGRVVDPDGKPVKGAVVSVAGWEAVPGKRVEPKTLATTGADGRFEFALPADHLAQFPQPYLAAVADKHGLAVHPLTEAGAKDVTLTLVKDSPLVGRLIDRNKQPVLGARVRVVAVWLPDKDDSGAALDRLSKAGWVRATGADPAGPFTRRLRTWSAPLPGLATDVRTDDKGQFTINGLGEGRFAMLLAERSGMVTTQIIVLNQTDKSVAVPARIPGESDRAIVTIIGNNFWHLVTTSRPLVGRVTDRETGKPIKDVTIRATDGPAFVWAATDADGWYSLDGLARPPSRLTAEPPDGAPYFALTQRGSDPPEKEDPVRLDFRLTRGVWLSGRVVEARTNTPVAGARVVYHPHQENTSPSATVVGKRGGREVSEGVRSEMVTGTDGQFHLLAAAGRGWVFVEGSRHYRVSAAERNIQGEIADRTPPREVLVGTRRSELPCAFNAVSAVVVDPDRPASCTITLEAGTPIEVRFVDPAGKPLAGVITDDPRLVPAGPAKPLPAKVQTIDGSNPERPMRLVVFHAETGLGAAYPANAGDPGPWTVTLKPTATVTARLLHRNGKPIANESVYIHAGDGRVPLSPKPMEVKTDKDGRVRVTGIIGDAEYLLWCLELADKQGGSRSRLFTAKPGEVKDLGDLKQGS
jgi:RNA polymerase sigma factor (sigma-70 family)